MKNYFFAIATLMGTIIGVGIFTIPFVIVKAGVLALLVYIISLGVVQYYLHLIFAQVALSIPGRKRLPGYVAVYYGKPGKIITLIFNLLTDYGAIIAYIIVGGLFLHELCSPLWGGSLLFYTAILFIFEALVVLYGLKVVARAEFVMTAILVILIVFISYRGLFSVNFSNYSWLDWRYFLLPYGPIFFAVSGMVAIPEICQIMENDRRRIKSVIFWGSFLSYILMLVFILVVVGITGPATSIDALAGLNLYFGNGFMKLILFFGLLVVITSMIAVSEATREIFRYDFQIRRKAAWALACLVPFAFYLFGVQDLTKVVSLTGSVAGGILGVIVIRLLFKTRKVCRDNAPIRCGLGKAGGWLLSLLFIGGFIYELWNVFFNGL